MTDLVAPLLEVFGGYGTAGGGPSGAGGAGGHGGFGGYGAGGGPGGNGGDGGDGGRHRVGGDGGQHSVGADVHGSAAADAQDLAGSGVAVVDRCGPQRGELRGVANYVGAAHLARVDARGAGPDPCAAAEADARAFLAFRSLMRLFRRCFLTGLEPIRADIAALGRHVCASDPALHRHLVRVGAGGYEFAFQGLLLGLRRELAWGDANDLWDALVDYFVVLPNIGREGHSYLAHITSQYGALAPHTLFTQGVPNEYDRHFRTTLHRFKQQCTDFLCLGSLD
ncbi:hypothetical protein FOA52_001236 [Chlamydomonas sp. UWO 241]|nr:hypothetical protein FOA52_001236 [Chlamydomonas sp. UWO 241]